MEELSCLLHERKAGTKISIFFLSFKPISLIFSCTSNTTVSTCDTWTTHRSITMSSTRCLMVFMLPPLYVVVFRFVFLFGVFLCLPLRWFFYLWVLNVALISPVSFIIFISNVWIVCIQAKGYTVERLFVYKLRVIL